ncbi:MAG: caspase family protein [Scytonema sp. PMC 1069.18]|nr:caspase family protein [Scytonema sp. PMC 1069.18]MEC4887836.1 caspase family protein [Scytonema sp. PMC 1070.18]
MSRHNEFNRNFAVIIGINNYQNSIRELTTAVPDALKLAQIIQKQHENLKPQYQAQNRYEVQLFLNQRASLSQLNQLIADFKQGQISLENEKVTLTKDDRLLFYFAGHGIALDALENQEGPVGYLIPQDAISGDSSTYLPMQDLHDALNALPCRHMLAILDCCFAGAFRWASLKREVVPKVKVYKERYDRFISDRAWQVITSAADDQKAIDFLGSRGIVTDGNEVHSPFAKALFDALLGKGADLNQDGIITATELYSYLRDRVEILTEKHYQRQTPSLCPLRKHDKGEFIFLSPEFDRDKLEDAPPLNVENNPYKGLQSYDEKDSKLFFGREEHIEKLFQKIVANNQPLTLVVGASGTGKSSLMKAGLLPRLRHSPKHQFQILDPMRPGETPLKALVQTLQGGELARRQVPKSELVYADEKENTRVQTVIKHFSDARLIVEGSNSQGKPYVEPAHDALVLGWDKLLEWVKQEQEDLSLQRRLTPAALLWKDKKEARFLWNAEPYLDVLKEILNSKKSGGKNSKKDNWLNQLEAEFVRRSIRKKRSNTIVRWSIAGLVTSGSVIFSAAIWLQLQQTELRAKAARAEVLLSTDPVNALVLAIQATGQNISLSKLPFQKILNPVQSSLLSVVEVARETNRVVHKNGVQSVTFSPDGQYIASGSKDGIVRLWDKQGNLIGETKEPHRDGVKFVKFIPDSQYIVSYGEDKIVRLWDLKGNPHSRFTPFEIPNSSVIALSQNGQYIVSGNQDGTIQWWNLNGNRIGQPFKVHESEIISIALSSNGQYMVSSSNETVRLWDLKRNSMKELYQKAEDDESFLSVAFSPDDKWIVGGQGIYRSGGGGNGMLWVWDIKGNKLSEDNVHDSMITSVVFSPNNKKIVSGSLDDTVRFLGINAKFQHSDQVDSVAFSPDGRYVVSGSKDGTMRIWDLKWKGTSISESNQTNDESSFAVAFSPDGKYIVSGTGSNNGTVQLWEQLGKSFGKEFKKDDRDIISLSQDKKIIVTVTKQINNNSGEVTSSTVELWNLLEKKREKLFTKPFDFTSIALSPDGKKIITGINNSVDNNSLGSLYTLQLWDLKGKQIGEPFRGHSDFITSVAFSPDSQYVVSKTNCLDQGDYCLSLISVRLWDLEGNPIGNPFTETSDRMIVYPGNWQGGLEVACDRLRYHPVLVEAKTDEARGARETCQKYVWDKTETLSSPTTPPPPVESFLPSRQAIAENYYTRGSEEADSKYLQNFPNILAKISTNVKKSQRLC